MIEKSFLNTRLRFTAIITIAIWLLLAWDHYHGGVPSHHLLARKDLPAISNWWGGLLLPLLTWFLLYRTQKRLMYNNIEKATLPKISLDILYGFVAALFFGVLLSVFFMLGNRDIPGYMLIALFVLSLFLPVYRAECMLGFVLGMTFTFGTVLPTIIGSLLVLITAVLYLYVRTLVLYIASGFVRMASSGKHGPANK
ncbi:MAG: hypothetical protein IPP72_15710 [Chitinophagaceae bacterium]|nr:hypothetical protein [Chitinophagaceae bacterium]